MKKVNKKYKHLETRPNTVFIVLIENSSESFHCIHFPGGAKEKQRLFFPSGFCPIHLKNHQYVMMHQFSTEYQEIFSKHIFFTSPASLLGVVSTSQLPALEIVKRSREDVLVEK